MEIKAIDHNVNIVAMEKDGKKYGMCCAWCTQVSDDRLICAIGPQSATGRAIEAGDVIGFSNLAKGQMQVAFALGDLQRHSDTDDKLAGVAHRADEGAILIEGARAQVKCQVIDVLHLQGIEAANVVYLQMLDGVLNEGEALHISDLPMA